jgi:hypothetical protein
VLVQTPNSRRDVLRESKLPGNGRAALTAGLDQVPRYLAAVLDELRTARKGSADPDLTPVCVRTNRRMFGRLLPSRLKSCLNAMSSAR